jgi:hypothetical protein
LQWASVRVENEYDTEILPLSESNKGRFDRDCIAGNREFENAAGAASKKATSQLRTPPAEAIGDGLLHLTRMQAPMQK